MKVLNRIRETLDKFIKSQIPHAESALVYGSYLWRRKPNDIDIIIITPRGHRRYRVIVTPVIRLEIEYVPKPFLNMYIENYHWWYEDWELEAAKYVHGKIIFDVHSTLSSFRQRLINLPENIRVGLISHRIGYCVLSLNKMEYLPPNSFLYELFNNKYIKNLSYLTLLLKRSFPVSHDIPKCVPNEYKEIINELFPKMVSIHRKREGLNLISKQCVPIIKSYLMKSGYVPLKYITQYYGYEYIAKTFNIDFPFLGEDIWLESLGEWDVSKDD